MGSPGSLRAGIDPLLASCLWGGMYVVSRAGFGLIPPVTLGALRVVIGGAALTLALWLAARRNPKLAATARLSWTSGDRWRAISLGGIVAATIITQFLGTALASAHDGALLTTSTPVFVVLLAWMLLGERPRWPVVAGMLLAVVGVAIVVAAQTATDTGSSANQTALLGDGLLVLSALCWALFTVVGAPLIRRHSALVAATSATRWSLLFMLPAAAIELALRDDWRALSFSPGAVGAVLYLGLGATALAWFLWYRGIAHMEAGVASIYFFAQPVVGGILAGLFLHEALTGAFWLGGLVLAAGILVVAWAPGHE